MDHQQRNKILPGIRVAIVLKKDQKTGILTEGIVQDILTNSANHHRGIKVRLTDGQVGRIQKILQEGEIAPKHVSELKGDVAMIEEKPKETTIYLVRHSEALTQVENTVVSHTDQQINEKIILSVPGEMKALELSKNPLLQKVDAVWSSDYVRAVATAKYIAYRNRLPIQIDCNLGERKLGDLEHLTQLGNEKSHSFTVEQLLDMELNNTDGESALEVRQRMYDCIQRILTKYEGKTVVLVSHGAAMKFLLTAWCEYQIEDNSFLFQKNTKISAAFASPSLFALSFLGKELQAIKEIPTITKRES